jgi:hypothetical protein
VYLYYFGFGDILLKLFQERGDVLLKFRCDATAVSAFQMSERIVRPKDNDGYERPKIVATFDRSNDRRKVVVKKLNKPTAVVEVVDSSGKF